MKIIAFAGSNSSKSINKKLATYAASLFENAAVEVLDLNEYEAPLFSVDTEIKIGKAEKADAFVQKINSATVLVVSLAENNGNYSASFKNLIDWCSRIDKGFFQNKPMLLMATSPGGRGGKGVLEIAQNNLPRFDANIQAVFSLPSFEENFDVENNKISNEELNGELKDAVEKLQIIADEKNA
ncbi:NADPH-dependent FMN reductase [Flavobacterium sp. SM2513]|uniref:NADPH-dependent FMN reductase n=1 Tax=Flavobacterium sp. SM2513 TaxID=3424766 RepID=UPI003D7F4CE9